MAVATCRSLTSATDKSLTSNEAEHSNCVPPTTRSNHNRDASFGCYYLPTWLARLHHRPLCFRVRCNIDWWGKGCVAGIPKLNTESKSESQSISESLLENASWRRSRGAGKISKPELLFVVVIARCGGRIVSLAICSRHAFWRPFWGAVVVVDAVVLLGQIPVATDAAAGVVVEGSGCGGRMSCGAFFSCSAEVEVDGDDLQWRIEEHHQWIDGEMAIVVQRWRSVEHGQWGILVTTLAKRLDNKTGSSNCDCQDKNRVAQQCSPVS